MYKKNLLSIAIVLIFTLALIGQVYAAGIAPTLVASNTYAVLGHTTVTNTGPTLIIGDLGLHSGTAVTGFPPGIVVPPSTIHIADAAALAALNDATAAYGFLNQGCDFTPAFSDLAGQNLVPGVYCFATSVSNTGVLTLNGGAADVWIFKIGSTLTAGPGSTVVGATGAESECNVFWRVGSSATLNTTSQIMGTIIANNSISLNTGATINGRAFALTGAVTLDTNTIDASVCGAAAPAGVGATKVFSPLTILRGNESTLTITFTNAEPGPATLLADFTDTFPLGVVVADVPNLATTCAGGIPSIGLGGNTVTLPTGSVIPAAAGVIPGSCTLSVDVTASTAGSYTNTITAGALVTDEGNNVSPATAVLTVRNTPAPRNTDSGSGLPVFPETGSGAPIFSEVSRWNLFLFGGILAFALIVGVRIFRRSYKPKQ